MGCVILRDVGGCLLQLPTGAIFTALREAFHNMFSSTRSVRIGCALLAIILLGMSGTGVTRLNAQAATATILGTVTDASGATIPDAAVQVKNTGTGAPQTTTSDAQRRFRVS